MGILALPSTPIAVELGFIVGVGYRREGGDSLVSFAGTGGDVLVQGCAPVGWHVGSRGSRCHDIVLIRRGRHGVGAAHCDGFFLKNARPCAVVGKSAARLDKVGSEYSRGRRD